MGDSSLESQVELTEHVRDSQKNMIRREKKFITPPGITISTKANHSGPVDVSERSVFSLCLSYGDFIEFKRLKKRSKIRQITLDILSNRLTKFTLSGGTLPVVSKQPNPKIIIVLSLH